MPRERPKKIEKKQKKKKKKKKDSEDTHVKAVPVVSQKVMNPTSSHEDVGSILGLTQQVRDPAWPGAVV